MRLLVEDLIFLKSELSKTRIMNEEDLAYIKVSHPQLYFATHLKKDEGVSLFPNKSWVYTLENKELNEFICNKFEEPIDNLYIIHRLSCLICSPWSKVKYYTMAYTVKAA